MSSKLITNLSNIRKVNKSKIVLCHGVFDLLHIGHINYFEAAKKNGNILVVSITSNEFVNKGPGRPAFNIQQRLNCVSALEIVDYVYVSENETAIDIIKQLQPNFYCKGLDYYDKPNDLNLKKEINQLKKNKRKGIFKIVDTKLFSSSKVINKFDLNNFDNECSDYLKKLSKKFGKIKINEDLKKISKLNILVLGEIIIDEYILTEMVGVSGKEPMNVLKIKDKIKFLGGTGYIANLLSNFSDNVNLLSYFKAPTENKKFLKDSLSKKINFIPVKTNINSIAHKIRYVDSYKNTKILGVYSIDENKRKNVSESDYLKKLDKYLKNSDLIICADFGHGEISEKIKNKILLYKSKLFVNSQLNAFSRGYHSILNYKSLNSISVNETELRQELKDRYSNVENLVKKLKKKLNFKNLIITQGKNGGILFTNSKNKITKSTYPAFNKNPIDTIGAGDTFFSIVSVFLAGKINPEISSLYASFAASYSSNFLGNKEYFNKYLLAKFINHIFK